MGDWLDILVIGVVNGVVLGLVLIFSIRKGRRANLYLGLLLLNFSIFLLDQWLAQDGFYFDSIPFPLWAFYSYLLIPPLLLFFVRASLDAGFRWSAKSWWFLVPGFADMLFHLVSYLLWKLKDIWLFAGTFGEIYDIGREVTSIVWMGWVLWYTQKQLKAYQQQIKESYSDLQQINYRWLRQLSSFGMVLWVLWVIIRPMDLWVFQGNVPFFFFFLLWGGVAVWIFMIAVQGLIQPVVFHQELIEDLAVNVTTATKDTTKNVFAGYDAAYALQQLQHLMEEEKYYQQPKLSLKDVAATLGLPIRYVSYLINSHLDTNFHDYINTYRVEEVMAKINDPDYKHLTFLALALDAGFNSKSSFNQVFKKYTGLTPSQFKQNNRKR